MMTRGIAVVYSIKHKNQNITNRAHVSMWLLEIFDDIDNKSQKKNASKVKGAHISDKDNFW